MESKSYPIFVEVEDGIYILQEDIAKDPLIGRIGLLSNYVADAHLSCAVGLAHVVFRRDTVSDSREGELHGRHGTAGYHVVGRASSIGASRNLSM